MIRWWFRPAAGVSTTLTVRLVRAVDTRARRIPACISGRSTVVAALRSARVDPAAAIPTGSARRAAAACRSRREPVVGARAWLATNRSVATRPCRRPPGDRPCRADPPPRARRLTVGCSTSQIRPRHACGLPSRGGCWRRRGTGPNAGMRDIRHDTSVLTRRRWAEPSGRTPSPRVSRIRGTPFIRALAIGPSPDSCAVSLRECVAEPAVNVPAS
jgi:hypothetical protein